MCKECLWARVESRPCVLMHDGERRDSADWQGRDGPTLLLSDQMGGFCDSDVGWHVCGDGLRMSDGTLSSLAARKNRLEQLGGTHVESLTSHLRCDKDNLWTIVHLQVLTTFDNRPKQLCAGVANLQLLPTLLFIFPLISSVLAVTSMPASTPCSLSLPPFYSSSPSLSYMKLRCCYALGEYTPCLMEIAVLAVEIHLWHSMSIESV